MRSCGEVILRTPSSKIVAASGAYFLKQFTILIIYTDFVGMMMLKFNLGAESVSRHE